VRKELRYFLREDLQMAKEHMKKMLSISDHQAMRIKTTKKYRLTSTGRAIIERERERERERE
jgi:hypothetical protein